MSKYIYISCLGVRLDDNDNRITLTWIGPDEIERTYSVRQNILDQYTTAEELKAAIDLWTQVNLGYTLDDLFIHLNRDGTFALATGALLDVWPEDMPAEGV